MSASQHERPELSALRTDETPEPDAGRRQAPAWLALIWAVLFLLSAVGTASYAVLHVPENASPTPRFHPTVTVQGEPYPGLTQARVDEAMKSAKAQLTPAHFTLAPGYCASQTAPTPPEYLVCLNVDERGDVMARVVGDKYGRMDYSVLEDNLNSGHLGTAVRAFVDIAFDEPADGKRFPWISSITAAVLLIIAVAISLSALRRWRVERAWRSAWTQARRRLARIVNELDDAQDLTTATGWAPDPLVDEAMDRASSARSATLTQAHALLNDAPASAPRGNAGRRRIARLALKAQRLTVDADAAQLALSVLAGGSIASNALSSLARPILRAAQDLVFIAPPDSAVAQRSAQLEATAAALANAAPHLAGPAESSTTQEPSVPGEPVLSGEPAAPRASHAPADTDADAAATAAQGEAALGGTHAPSYSAALNAWGALVAAVEAQASGLLTAPNAPSPGTSAQASMEGLRLLGWRNSTVSMLRERVDADRLGRLAWDPQLVLPHSGTTARGRDAERRRTATALRGSGHHSRRARPSSGAVSGRRRTADALGVMGLSTLITVVIMTVYGITHVPDSGTARPSGGEHVGSVQVIGGPDGLTQAVTAAVKDVPLAHRVDVTIVEADATALPHNADILTAPFFLRERHPEFFDPASGEPLPGRVVLVMGPQSQLYRPADQPNALTVWGVITPQPATKTNLFSILSKPDLSTSFTPMYGWPAARTFGASVDEQASAVAWAMGLFSIGQMVEDHTTDPLGSYGWMVLVMAGWIVVTGLGLVLVAWYRRRGVSAQERALDRAAAERFSSASRRLDALLVGWDRTELDAVAAGDVSLLSVGLAENELAVAAAWREDLSARRGPDRKGSEFQRDVEMFTAQIGRLDGIDRSAASDAAKALDDEASRTRPGSGTGREA